MYKKITRTGLFISSCTVLGLLFTLVFASASFAGTSSAPKISDVRISIELEEASIPETFREIESKTAFRFLYNKTVVETIERRVNMQFRSASVESVLMEIGSQTGAHFRQVGQTIMAGFPEKGDELVEQQTVSGRIVDAATDEPLPGVNIVVDGTTMGTVSDLDGTYSLSVPSLNETLRVSYIGYVTQEIAINGRNTIDVSLSVQILRGEEMVVTAFGIEREVKSLTYSTQGVDTQNLTTAREPNVMSSLSGRVAGLNVANTSGGPGAATRVNLRGNRSFTGSSEPLYVLDGVPIRGNPEDLSPDEIESINVLKGGNAAALYGSAAQNGVILINTKRARANEVNVSVSSNFQVYEPNILFDFQNEYGQGTGGEYSPGSEFSFGPRMEGQQVPFWSPDPNHQLAGTTVALTPQPNNVRDVFQTGYNLANNISANLGGERTQTAFSYTYTDANGIVPGNTLQRNNVSVRVTSQLMDKLHLDSRVAYTRNVRTNPPTSLTTATEYANPIRGAYRMPRSIQTQHYSDYFYTDEDNNIRQNFFNPGSNGGFNPYWAIHMNNTDMVRERVLARASLVYNFTESLSLMARAAFDGSNGENKIRLANDSYIIADNGHYEVTKNDAREFNADFLLSFDRDFAQNWNVNTNLGGNIQQRRNYSLNANTGNLGLTVPNLYSLSNTQSVEVAESIGSPRNVHSLYGAGQIGWRNSIFLDVTARNDWSSTLPEESWSYFYPSVGLSIVLSDLLPSFPAFFSYAQLRGSYAEVGNPAPSFALTRSANIVPGGSAGFVRVSGSLPNENLRPERTQSTEVGADLRFFQGRLGLDVTYYHTTTVDQLFSVALPIGSGATSFFTNGGDIQNQGIELSLSMTPVQRTSFNWDVIMNWNRNRNEVVKISDDLDRLQIGSDFLREVFLIEGRPYGETTSRGYVRDDQGRVIVGSNGIPEFTPARSDVVVANFQPDWLGSILNSFVYRNVSVSFLIDHRQGGTIASMSNTLMYADGVTKQTLQGREPGDELIFGQNFMTHETAVMQVGTDANGNPIYEPNTHQTDAESFWRAVGGRNAPVGEAFVEEATNTRLREVTIGYNFGQPLMQRIGLPFSNINLSLVGRNLLFLYRASDNIDPDLMAGTNRNVEGWEILSPPTTRSIGANLKIDF